jgi:hypothetical protein
MEEHMNLAGKGVVVAVLVAAAGWLVGMGCDGGQGCVREVRCVTACGQPSQTAGCGPCPAGMFDDISCPDVTSDGGTADAGGLDAGPVDASAADAN